MSLWENVFNWMFMRRSPKDTEVILNMYRTALFDKIKDWEEQKKIIERLKKKHPDNGIELDMWRAREEKLHHRILALMKENMEVRTQLSFWEKLKPKT